MIRVSGRPGRLTLRGHAGWGRRGEDIVCAAVSILVETLARSLPEEAAQLGEGFAEFRFAPGNPAAAFALRGLSLLAESYPDNVKVSIDD